MASINVSEKDFQTLAAAAMEAMNRGDIDDATALDKLARKVNAALANGSISLAMRRLAGAGTRSLSWKDVPSVIGLKA